MSHDSIAFIGFGEAGTAITGGWSDREGVRAYDIKSEDPTSAADQAALYSAVGVSGCVSRAEALYGVTAVFCTVTADRALIAAQQCADELARGAWWFDMNSCAPATKQRAAEVISKAGGRYVDVAVMAPVYPKRHQVPLLIAGEAADEAAEFLRGLEMQPVVAGTKIGAASSIKMLRSIMVKGMEALSAECLLAATRAGVDGEVMESLSRNFPGMDWPQQIAYNLERMVVHGQRRAAEMEEVALTLRDLGLPDDMASAVVLWQRRMGRRSAAECPAPDLSQGYHAVATRILEQNEQLNSHGGD